MKKRLLATLLVLSNLLMPVSAHAAGEQYTLEGNSGVEQEVSITPYMVVKKYVSVTVTYAMLAFVPKTYFYSYYDHDYSTTMKGYLPVVEIINCIGYVEATFAGYVSAAI
ncbi:hypothetical protein [Novisyntrophococcus fermenticellae]|uniref:hypothetical protein n=1 Tax=Novisyntrophococcus fermenticellae TaxID=2068655 RepID=UPI001E312BB6|nr:hypothetical protein [Novisyntrophococcus fermenticellae]